MAVAYPGVMPLLLPGASDARAQSDYPARPIRLVVAYPPGGTVAAGMRARATCSLRRSATP